MTGDNDSDCLQYSLSRGSSTDRQCWADQRRSFYLFSYLKIPIVTTLAAMHWVLHGSKLKDEQDKIVPECKKFGCYILTFADWGSPLLQPDSSSDSIISCYSTRQGVKIEPLMSRQDRLQLLQQSGPHLQQHAALCSKCAELACGDTRASNGPSKRLKFYKLASQYYVYLPP